VVSIEAYS